jgi:hypothetical protein
MRSEFVTMPSALSIHLRPEVYHLKLGSQSYNIFKAFLWTGTDQVCVADSPSQTPNPCRPTQDIVAVNTSGYMELSILHYY